MQLRWAFHERKGTRAERLRGVSAYFVAIPGWLPQGFPRASRVRFVSLRADAPWRTAAADPARVRATAAVIHHWRPRCDGIVQRLAAGVRDVSLVPLSSRFRGSSSAAPIAFRATDELVLEAINQCARVLIDSRCYSRRQSPVFPRRAGLPTFIRQISTDCCPEIVMERPHAIARCARACVNKMPAEPQELLFSVSVNKNAGGNCQAARPST